jgi:hypothetical protein
VGDQSSGVNIKFETELDLKVREFLRFVLSDEKQEAVQRPEVFATQCQVYRWRVEEQRVAQPPVEIGGRDIPESIPGQPAGNSLYQAASV